MESTFVIARKPKSGETAGQDNPPRSTEASPTNAAYPKSETAVPNHPHPIDNSEPEVVLI